MVHVDEDTAPMPDEYLPPWHKMQGNEPFTSLYDPAAHAVHVPPSEPVWPILQAQLVTSKLPRPEFASAGHAMQAAFEVSPVPGEYVPSLQRVHAAEPLKLLY